MRDFACLVSRLGVAALALAAANLQAPSAKADETTDFYRGKAVTLLVGYSAGGGYDIYARTIARYMGDHMPGSPKIVVQNMPGAGSISSANYLYGVAVKDGSIFGTFGRGVPMEPLIGIAKTQYDATKFTWIGSAADELSVCAVTQKSGIKTFEDVLKRDVAVGGEGSGSDPDTYAMMVRGILGARLKLVTGYPGGNDMTLAIERGEIDGRCGWSWGSIKATRPEWAQGPNRLNILMVMSSARHEELHDIPAVIEKAKNERERQIINLVVSRQTIARPFAAPPALPPARRDALRKGFDATMKDPRYIAEAKSLSLDVAPVTGAEIEKLIQTLYATPKDVVEQARAVIAAGSKAD